MQVTDRMIELARGAHWKVDALSRTTIVAALSAVLEDEEVRREIFRAIAAGDQGISDLTEEPPIGSAVIDCDGDKWIRGEWGWGIKHARGRWLWSELQTYSPLRLAS